MQNKLLNCPFCGGEFEEPINTACKQGDTWLWSTECMECGLFIYDKDKDNLIKRVNTRKPMEQIVEQLEEKKWDIHDWRDRWRNEIIDECIEIVKGGVDNAE